MAARLVLATVGMSLLAAPSVAGDSNGNVQIRVGGTGVLFDDDVTSIRTSTGVNLKSAIGADAEVGDVAVPTLTLTYFFTNNFAIEAICCTAHINVKGMGGLAPLGDIAGLRSRVVRPVCSVRPRSRFPRRTNAIGRRDRPMPRRNGRRNSSPSLCRMQRTSPTRTAATRYTRSSRDS
jgi:OmpW family